jgi:RHS repeat-associated protein
VQQGFTGQDEEPDLGLIDYHGRIYDPAIGRFLSRDPIIRDADFSQALNPYSYVSNNPLSHSDPSGLEEGGCEDDPPRPMGPDTPAPPSGPPAQPVPVPSTPAPTSGGLGIGIPPSWAQSPTSTSPNLPPTPAADGSLTKLRDNTGTQPTPWGGRALLGEAPWEGVGPEAKTIGVLGAGALIFVGGISTAAIKIKGWIYPIGVAASSRNVADRVGSVFDQRQQRYPWRTDTRGRLEAQAPRDEHGNIICATCGQAIHGDGVIDHFYTWSRALEFVADFAQYFRDEAEIKEFYQHDLRILCAHCNSSNAYNGQVGKFESRAVRLREAQARREFMGKIIERSEIHGGDW